MLTTITYEATGQLLTQVRSDGSVHHSWAPRGNLIDNSKGDALGNVRIACAIFNMMRADCADDALLSVFKALAEHAPA